MEKKLYKYEGCVLNYSLVLTRDYTAYVYATSVEQALYVLTLRFKKENNLNERAKVKLLKESIKEVK